MSIHLLSHPETRRAANPAAEAAPSVAQVKQRWRRAIIECRLPIRRRFDLLALIEFAAGFGGSISIGEAPSWALVEGILRQRGDAYEFDHQWLVSAEADAERRWLERHGAPMRSTREPANAEPAEVMP